MKRLITILTFLCTALLGNAQIKTYSVYDTNLDDSVNVTDVNRVVDAILHTSPYDQKVVKAEVVDSLLQRIAQLEAVIASFNNTNANTTAKSKYATLLEMPKIAENDDFLLLTKTDSIMGVNYTIEWNNAKRAQNWTCWEWNKTNNVKNFNRSYWKSGTKFNGYGGSGDPFQPDTDIPKQYRTELSDYSGSGYDRGHMCASADRLSSLTSNGQTFYLSNMHPQIGDLNSGLWQTMEQKVRTWRDAITSNDGTMYICKGGTISDVVIDNDTIQGTLDAHPTTGTSTSTLRMPVPRFFFMAVMKRTSDDKYSAMAFWVEHKADQKTPLTQYMITIDELEHRTGLDFFCNLPDDIEEQAESTLNTADWQ